MQLEHSKLFFLQPQMIVTGLKKYGFWSIVKISDIFTGLTHFFTVMARHLAHRLVSLLHPDWYLFCTQTGFSFVHRLVSHYKV